MRVVIHWSITKNNHTVTEEFGIKHNLIETHNRWKNAQLYSWRHSQVYDVLDKELFFLAVIKYGLEYEEIKDDWISIVD